MSKEAVAILDEAINDIKKYGWTQNSFGDKIVGYCMLGALPDGPGRSDAIALLFALIGGFRNNIHYGIVAFNDEEGRTKGDVLAVLKLAAFIAEDI